eukprot:1086278-Rhodomonas_salina.2
MLVVRSDCRAGEAIYAFVTLSAGEVSQLPAICYAYSVPFCCAYHVPVCYAYHVPFLLRVLIIDYLPRVTTFLCTNLSALAYPRAYYLPTRISVFWVLNGAMLVPGDDPRDPEGAQDDGQNGVLSGADWGGRSEIGAFAAPDKIHWAPVISATSYARARPCPGLPKTRSGKILRRVLRKMAAGTRCKSKPTDRYLVQSVRRRWVKVVDFAEDGSGNARERDVREVCFEGRKWGG